MGSTATETLINIDFGGGGVGGEEVAEFYEREHYLQPNKEVYYLLFCLLSK